MVARKALHIISTSFLECGDVLVNFSDGSSAIYEAEELEKLRPTPKQTIPACAATPVQATMMRQPMLKWRDDVGVMRLMARLM